MQIKVEGIFLTHLNFELIPENLTDPPKYSLGISIDTEIREEGKLLVLVARFDLAQKLEKPPFKFNFIFQGQFLGEGEGSPTLEEFGKIHAPAYIVPYARELVANITSRVSVLPTLVLPPINVYKLIEESEKPMLHNDNPDSQPTDEGFTQDK